MNYKCGLTSKHGSTLFLQPLDNNGGKQNENEKKNLRKTTQPFSSFFLLFSFILFTLLVPFGSHLFAFFLFFLKLTANSSPFHSIKWLAFFLSSFKLPTIFFSFLVTFIAKLMSLEHGCLQEPAWAEGIGWSNCK